MGKVDHYAVRMICRNPDCINKSVVFRKFNALEPPKCKLCDQVLTVRGASNIRRFNDKSIEKAKRELSGAR